jgi:protein-export membrane protein SecD
MTAAEAKDAPQRVLEILRNRIDQFGVVEPLLQLQGKDRIVIQLPGVTDRERAKGLVGKTAHLEFQIVSDDPELLKKALAGDPVPGYTLKYMKEKEKRDKEPVLVENKALVTGDMVADAFTDYETFGMPYVSLRLNPAGATTFENVTASNVGKRLAIVLDGEVYSAPVIRERIGGGSAQISGNFSMKEAQDLSLVLRSPLPAPVKIIEERSVGATLGSDSIEKGIRATLIGGLFVLVFMAVYYTVGGAIADVAVVLNILIITGFLGMFRATLSLPGIAGLVLTIGMAVDANVLIFERMREEHKLGKPIRATIAAGYDKAFLTIFDSNLTTLISALILFQFGTGPVRGFATTLSVGLIASMFTSLFVTRFIFDLFTQGEPRIKEIKMLQIIGRTNFDFMSFRKIAYTISLVVILVGLFAFWKRGEGMYGIDFRGGALQEFRLRKTLKLMKSGNASTLSAAALPAASKV